MLRLVSGSEPYIIRNGMTDSTLKNDPPGISGHWYDRFGITDAFGMVILVSFLLFLAVLFLVSVGCIGCFVDAADRSKWYELFKAGFVSLGALLTTIIGFYFGHRDTAQARKGEEAAVKKAINAGRIAEAVNKKEVELPTDEASGGEVSPVEDDTTDFGNAQNRPNK